MQERRLPPWLAWAMDRDQARRAPFLARSPLFAGLPRRLLRRLATRFLEKAYYSGEVVFHEGDPGRALFVVVEGTVEITQATPRGEHLVRTLGAGDAFGELALIDESPRSGSARIAEPARLLILYKTDFDALMTVEARIAVVVLRNLSRVLAVYARRNPVVVTEPAFRPEAADPP
jgi:CRP/FNR family cyclic AMP-dependent transcriptional regulator